MRPRPLHSQTVDPAVQRSKQRDVRFLHPAQTLAMRQLRRALVDLVRDCRAGLLNRNRFDRVSASDARYCPTDRLVQMFADARQAGARHEDFVAFCDQMRAVGDAMWMPAPITSIPELLRAETQAQGIGDIAAHEAMAHPECPSTLQRCAETLRHHARKAWDAARGLDARAARSRGFAS